MRRIVTILFALGLSASPALAAVDRATAVTTLAGFYHSADVCNLAISKAKVEAYAEANRPAGDTLFNVDVFRATQALYAGQKDWTKEQTAAYCKEAAATAKSLGMAL